MTAHPLEHLIDEYAAHEADCARLIERRQHRNNTYIQVLERELRQQRELVDAWKGVALAAGVTAALLGLALWGAG